jgi:hypothetical protein
MIMVMNALRSWNARAALRSRQMAASLDSAMLLVSFHSMVIRHYRASVDALLGGPTAAGRAVRHDHQWLTRTVLCSPHRSGRLSLRRVDAS